MTTTCVSGYWNIKNKHDDKFFTWFKNTLQINCPYVFFCSKEMIEIIKKYRNGLPTYFIECNIEEFYTYKYKNEVLTHPKHCPSVELNLIWNEKIFLLQKASIINPYNSEYFIWVDAGLCTYRHTSPPSTIFPNINKLKYLSKDKFNYSSSELTIYDENKFNTSNTLHHHISGTYVLHKNIIEKVVELYKTYLDKLVLNKNTLITDQIVLTHIYNDNKELFYKLCDGYGEIVRNLY
jgi:hypothetical protein